MGIFSIFKKKEEGTPRVPAAGAPAVDTRLRNGEPSRLGLDTEAERARQREIARETAAKIDAIELEMTSAIFDETEPAWGSRPRRPLTAAPGGAALTQPVPGAAGSTLAQPEPTTTVLLGGDDMPDALAAPASAPVVDESAILYANGQLPAAEQMLRDSLADLGRTERTPWWMLFDLYQASGNAQAFESTAIDYASHFETSPPAYAPTPVDAAAGASFVGVTPAEAFAGLLDDSIDVKLQRLIAARHANPVLRLDFAQVSAVTPQGCARLAAALQGLRGAGCELVLGGADVLVGVVRSSVTIGERSASKAPWLLLLELLQLQGREKDFEETAMDYCITYEVSPPSFEAQARSATAATDLPAASDRFMLPAIVTGDARALLAAIANYAGAYDPIVLDCSRLLRIDYPCAAALHEQLRGFAGAGRTIELRDLNHLVAALFRLLGVADCARLFPHKY